jgi:CCR4-NOT transcriptional complex subunit CAF120
MEGWVRIRVAGQTDWKSFWMVVSGPTIAAPTDFGPDAPPKPRRMSSLFGSHDSKPATPTKPKLSMYTSPKPKDRKKASLSMTQVTQAFAVYPERPELITLSTLMKLEGKMGDENTAGGMRSREGWLLVMPEIEAGSNLNPVMETLKWIMGQFIRVLQRVSTYIRLNSFS